MTVINIECRVGMKMLLCDNSIDSIVTDPPYGLSKQPNITEVLTKWLNNEDYKTSGSGFMGKKWDSFVPGPSYWKECYRVLKPGAWLIAFAGSRTQDLMGVSLRLSGFEIMDTGMWIYGSGFPKSLNIEKATNNPQWKGWGTALKPAYEPFIICRKPLDGTYANNILIHSIGGLNIDSGRIPIEKNDEIFSKNPNTQGGFGHGDALIYGDSKGAEMYDPYKGRWPANVIHDGLNEPWAK